MLTFLKCLCGIHNPTLIKHQEADGGVLIYTRCQNCDDIGVGMRDRRIGFDIHFMLISSKEVKKILDSTSQTAIS
jgi:hypothetical protein